MDQEVQHVSSAYLPPSYLLYGTGQETRKTSKEQTKIIGLMLEGPRPSTFFCFVLTHQYFAWITSSSQSYWLVSRVLIRTYCVLFCARVRAKKANKNIEQRIHAKLHNHLPPLTMLPFIFLSGIQEFENAARPHFYCLGNDSCSLLLLTTQLVIKLGNKIKICRKN